MRGWLDWARVERMNVWGSRPRTDEEAATWEGACADHWERRSAEDGDAGRDQVAALDIAPGQTVADVCCGTGPLTPWLARRARHVVALDASGDMLAYARRHVREAGVANVSFVQGNWFSLEPGVDYELCDVAVTRYAPTQGDLLRFSRCARERCYSIWNCAPADAAEHPIKAIRALAPQLAPKMRRRPEPNGRLFGYNVHFNLLYDAGADPTLSYTETRNRRIANSLDELCFLVLGGRPTDEQMALVRPRVAELACELPDGRVCWETRQRVAILGWDPREVDPAR